MGDRQTRLDNWLQRQLGRLIPERRVWHRGAAWHRGTVSSWKWLGREWLVKRTGKA